MNAPILLHTESMDAESIIRTYREGLSRIDSLLFNRNEKLLVVIDALDELASSQKELEVNNLFQFVPADNSFARIRFFVTSRPGEACNEFKIHMGRNIPVWIALDPMSLAEMKALIHLYGINTDQVPVAALFSATKGNALYLAAVLNNFKDGGNF